MTIPTIETKIPVTKQIKEILDHLYTENPQGRLCIGIWDDTAVPYTLYAVLINTDGTPMLGESSYGSETLEEAIEALYAEYCEESDG